MAFGQTFIASLFASALVNHTTAFEETQIMLLFGSLSVGFNTWNMYKSYFLKSVRVYARSFWKMDISELSLEPYTE